MKQPIVDIKIKKTSLNLDDCIKSVASQSLGGTVVFVGTVRDKTDNKPVKRLEFEAYDDMAINEMKKICGSAFDRWPIDGMVIHHRVGTVLPGETAVIIIAAAVGRQAAFLASRYAIDTLKKTVPIWKKEVYEDGAVWVSAHP